MRKIKLDLLCPVWPCRQSWPTRMDMHQDIEDSLAASSISHAGGPQAPARSTENLLNGHRSKGMMELGRREETTVTDSSAQVQKFVSVLLPHHHFVVSKKLLFWKIIFKILFQGTCANASGPAPGSGPIRGPAPPTTAAVKQRTCLFRSVQFGLFWFLVYMSAIK